MLLTIVVKNALSTTTHAPLLSHTRALVLLRTEPLLSLKRGTFHSPPTMELRGT